MLNEFAEVWAVWECRCLTCYHTWVQVSLLEHTPNECVKCGGGYLEIGGDGDDN